MAGNGVTVSVVAAIVSGVFVAMAMAVVLGMLVPAVAVVTGVEVTLWV